MSSRRRLQSRSQRTDKAPQPGQPEGLLPAYEIPSCPLSADAQRKIVALKTTHSYKAYDAQLKAAIANVTNIVADAGGRLAERVEEVEKINKKRPRDEDKTDEDRENEGYAKVLKKNVDAIVDSAEAKMRQLIDFADEMAIQGIILQDVMDILHERQAAEEEEAPADNVQALSAVELYREAKAAKKADYEASTKTARYANNNYYKSFKKHVHDGRYGLKPNPPPLEKASLWFADDIPAGPTAGDDSDDEIVMTGATESLKCPLTLQLFKEPYTASNKCGHSFEKSFLIEFHHKNAKVKDGSEKQVMCPTVSCEQMLLLSDFTDDHLLARKVERARLAEQAADDDSDDDNAPRGSASAPEGLGSSSDAEVSEARRIRERQVKRERQSLAHRNG